MQEIIIPTFTNLETKIVLQNYASQINPGRTIVEIGPWLGACTVRMSRMLQAKKKNNIIHVYDRFLANEKEVQEAERYGVILFDGENIEYIFKSYLNFYIKNIIVNKGNIRNARYRNGKIGLYIDDASSSKKYFDYLIKTFFKHFIPNETIICLTNYYRFRHTYNPGHRYQYYWMQGNKNQFQLIKNIGGCDTAIFLYKGKQNANSDSTI